MHLVETEGLIEEHVHREQIVNVFDKSQIYTPDPPNKYPMDFCSMNLPEVLVSPWKSISANVIAALSPTPSPCTCLTSYESDHLLLFLTLFNLFCSAVCNYRAIA